MFNTAGGSSSVPGHNYNDLLTETRQPLDFLNNNTCTIGPKEVSALGFQLLGTNHPKNES